MRRLLYVPIIHTEQDLGSLAEDIEERARTSVGGGIRQKHSEVVRLYWQTIADYWAIKNVAGYKIFQDGMPVDGVIGENIVKSLAASGSINHTIIAQLLEKGAQLVKTEDPEVLKEEYALTKSLLQSRGTLGMLQGYLRYTWRKRGLLKARDTYISKRINESLEEGETGVCFLGAFHQILSGLSQDIEVIALKNPAKVRAYQQKYSREKWEAEVNTLSAYLTLPITIESGGK